MFSGSEPAMVTNDLDFGLKIAHRPLEDAGADRLVNAFSAAEKYGVPCIVCSFGTATTIDVADDQRVLVGGLIAPGLNTLVSALKQSTSRLPEVELLKPEKILQNTTVGAIQSGIVHGYIALVDGLLSTVKQETDNATVIATGGSAALVAENTDKIDVVDNDLTLDGLRLLYERLQH
jgi:type III pantothenate kinase